MSDRSDNVMLESGRRGSESMLECRTCGVICELVVSPWRCLRARRECIYAFEVEESVYFGCLHKVFTPELDLGVFESEGGVGGSRSDPYGPVRVARTPRAECPVTIERAYSGVADVSSCSNPSFVREAFRLGS